jgi:hypothetical protein
MKPDKTLLRKILELLVLDKYVQAINKCDEYVMHQKACLAKLF